MADEKKDEGLMTPLIDSINKLNGNIEKLLSKDDTQDESDDAETKDVKVPKIPEAAGFGKREDGSIYYPREELYNKFVNTSNIPV